MKTAKIKKMKTKLSSLIFLSGMIILSSCYELPDTDSIVMPTWDIEGIHIPLVSQTKTLQDILENDSTLTWYPEDSENSPGVLYYSKIEEIEGSAVGEHLKLDQTNVSASSKVGTVTNKGTAKGKPIYDAFYEKGRKEVTDVPFTKNTIFVNYLKNQLEIAPEFKQKGIPFPTQLRKLIEDGLMENGVPSDFMAGKSVEAKAKIKIKV